MRSTQDGPDDHYWRRPSWNLTTLSGYGDACSDDGDQRWKGWFAILVGQADRPPTRPFPDYIARRFFSRTAREHDHSL